ncbi:MAG: glycine--tRNA ligase subunit beta, partial [Syntrophomonadaceae bacterium]|nr:glycine--tRNA ligase subunit beta [Syntrophomonadaceae bacterium]
MAKDFLLEIGVEELPSAYMTRVLTELKSSINNKFKELRINTGAIEVYGTPRRLVVFVKDVAEKQEDAVIESRGPKKNIAFDEKGEPTKATLGFARSQGVKVEDLQIREVSGVEYLFNVRVEQGDETIKVLPDLLVDLIKNISFPKSMRWGYYHLRFARPIRWILALYDQEIVNFSLENINSSNFTYGL